MKSQTEELFNKKEFFTLHEETFQCKLIFLISINQLDLMS